MTSACVRPIDVKISDRGSSIANHTHEGAFGILLCVASVAGGFDEKTQETVASKTFGEENSEPILEQIRRCVGRLPVGHSVEESKSGGRIVAEIPRKSLIELTRGGFCRSENDSVDDRDRFLAHLGILRDNNFHVDAQVRNLFVRLVHSWLMKSWRGGGAAFLDTFVYDDHTLTFRVHFNLRAT